MLNTHGTTHRHTDCDAHVTCLYMYIYRDYVMYTQHAHNGVGVDAAPPSTYAPAHTHMIITVGPPSHTARARRFARSFTSASVTSERIRSHFRRRSASRSH